MKKICTLAVVLLLATVVSSFAAASAAPASADAGKSLYGAITGTAAATDTLIGKLSKGVYAGWNVATSGYALYTMHQSGTKSFGSAHDATAIYRNDAKMTSAPSSASNSAFSSGNWTAM